MIAFFSNFFNHHQNPVAQELYRITEGAFYFIETQPLPNSYKKTGYPDFSNEPFVIKSWRGSDELLRAKELAMDADVVLYTPDAIDIVKPRLMTSKLSFDVGERWFKQGFKNIFSYTLIKMQWVYHFQINKESNYKLCASAYGSNDQKLMHSFVHKCYKWGYFTKVDPLEVPKLQVPRNGKVFSMMWCARMIGWKHPELPIKLAAKLKSSGLTFVLNMYGEGVLKPKIINMASSYDVDDVVNFCGNVPNDIVLREMRNHDVFLLTSDRNEGWGAVANEAMANGCVLVGSNEVGAVPYLLNHQRNGMVFKSKDINSLYDSVKYLIDNPDKRQEMANNAYETISTTWSPTNAAKNLLCLIDSLQKGKLSPIIEGPCSLA